MIQIQQSKLSNFIFKFHIQGSYQNQVSNQRKIMKGKKNINFKQEIQNSQKFLQKLQTIKKTSKDIKDKNKLTQHRNLWVKQFKYLSRLQRDMDLELTNYFQAFDSHFEYQMQENQIFGATNYKNYSQLKQHIQQNFNTFERETFYQVRTLPLLEQKCRKVNYKNINKTEVLQILADIQRVLDGIEQQNTQLELQITKQQQIQKKIEEQNFDEFQEDYNNLSNLKQISNNIKGFDFQKQKIKKLKESEQNLINYLDCFNDKLSQDQIYEVINEFNHANKLLEQTFQLQNQKLDLDYEDALKLDKQVIESSENFNKISHIYSTYIGRGKSVQLYFERLSIQFPKMNRQTLNLLTSYLEAKIYKQKKSKAMKRNYYREKQQLFAKVDKQIHSRIEKKIEKAKKKAEQLQRRQQKLKLDKQLQLLRTDYNKRKQQKQKQKKAEEIVLKESQRKKQALRRLYLDQLSKKAEQVIQVKTEKQKQQEMMKLTMKQKQEQQKRKKIQQNKPKVQIRQSIQRKKIQKKVEERQIREKRAEVQAQRIKNAIENYKFRPEVQFSEQRLNKPTQALLIKRQTVMDMADKVQLSKVTGYSANQLMSDMRYKLNTALQQAGLSNTDYARQLIVSMSKRPT